MARLAVNYIFFVGIFSFPSFKVILNGKIEDHKGLLIKTSVFKLSNIGRFSS